MPASSGPLPTEHRTLNTEHRTSNRRNIRCSMFDVRRSTIGESGTLARRASEGERPPASIFKQSVECQSLVSSPSLARRAGVIGHRLALVLSAACGLALAGCKSPLDNIDIKDVYGPAGRQAKNKVEQAKREADGALAVGLDEFEAARKLYDEQKYVEARKAFHKIVKKYKKKSEP